MKRLYFVSLKRLNYITVLRALAILMVLTVHIGQQNTKSRLMHPFINTIISNGARGVQLFYILSAFILYSSYKYHQSKDRYPVLSFYLRRFFRIAPLFYLAVIFYLWHDGFGPRYWLGDAQIISKGNIISNIFFCMP